MLCTCFLVGDTFLFSCQELAVPSEEAPADEEFPPAEEAPPAEDAPPGEEAPAVLGEALAPAVDVSSERGAFAHILQEADSLGKEPEYIMFRDQVNLAEQMEHVIGLDPAFRSLKRVREETSAME